MSRSLAVMPLTINRAVMGLVSFAHTRREVTFTSDVIAALRLAAEIFASALERKRVEEALRDRLRFERQMAELSSHLIDAPTADLDLAIEHSLGTVAAAEGFDRMWLMQIAESGTGLYITHEWAVPGLTLLDRNGDGPRRQLVSDDVWPITWRWRCPISVSRRRRAATPSRARLPRGSKRRWRR